MAAAQASRMRRRTENEAIYRLGMVSVFWYGVLKSNQLHDCRMPMDASGSQPLNISHVPKHQHPTGHSQESAHAADALGLGLGGALVDASCV